MDIAQLIDPSDIQQTEILDLMVNQGRFEQIRFLQFVGLDAEHGVFDAMWR